MNRTFQKIGLLRSSLVSLIVMLFVPTIKWITKIFVDCNRSDKGGINKLRMK